MHRLLTCFSVLLILAALHHAVAPASARAQNVCGPNPSPPNPSDPAIRITMPAAGARVASPLRVSGRARVFEAVVSLALKDAAGATIAQGFTQAAAGAPELAPFATDLPFRVARETPACLWVFEASPRDGSPTNVVQAPLVLLPSARYVEAALNLDDPRPCIPEPGQRTCDAMRTSLWNGEAVAWAARGVTNPDARFNETVVFRVRAGDPAAIRNIARILGWPYLKVTRIHFVGDEFVEVTNLGGGAQNLAGWSLRSPASSVSFPFRADLTLAPGQSCRFSTGGLPPGGTPCLTAAGRTDLWPDDAGRVVLFYDALALPGDDTLYSADPDNQPPPPNLQGTVMEPPAADAVIFTLSTSRDTYAPGEAIEFRMLLRNAGTEPQTLEFPSGQDFDITVTNDSGDIVWQWSTGRAFTQIFRTVVLPPGGGPTYFTTWDQRTNAGARVAPATYQASARLAVQGRDVRSNTVTIHINPT